MKLNCVDKFISPSGLENSLRVTTGSTVRTLSVTGLPASNFRNSPELLKSLQSKLFNASASAILLLLTCYWFIKPHVIRIPLYCWRFRKVAQIINRGRVNTLKVNVFLLTLIEVKAVFVAGR